MAANLTPESVWNTVTETLGVPEEKCNGFGWSLPHIESKKEKLRKIYKKLQRKFGRKSFPKLRNRIKYLYISQLKKILCYCKRPYVSSCNTRNSERKQIKFYLINTEQTKSAKHSRANNECFTPPEDAKICIDKFRNVYGIDLYKKIVFVDVGCGTGNFFFLLPKNRRYAIDINNEFINFIHNGIPIKYQSRVICSDFLDENFSPEILNIEENSEYLCAIGNIPFGKRKDLILKFIKQACKFFKYIAFLIPSNFVSKRSPKYKELKELVNIIDTHKFRCSFQVFIFNYSSNKLN